VLKSSPEGKPVSGQNKAALMRSVNEGIAFFATDVEPSDPGEPDRWSFVCECGSSDCDGWIELELSVYAALRAQPTGVVLAEGHDPLRDEAQQPETAGAALI
jgi:hypothetical protein